MGTVTLHRGHAIHEVLMRNGRPLAVVRAQGVASYGPGSAASILHRTIGASATLLAMAWIDAQLGPSDPSAEQQPHPAAAASNSWEDRPYEPPYDPAADLAQRHRYEQQRLTHIAELQLRADFTRHELLQAFRAAVKDTHPDYAGAPDAFQRATEAKRFLLADLDINAPPPIAIEPLQSQQFPQD